MFRATVGTPGSGEALYAVAQFALIALFVHGTTHPGRFGLYDSFNRIIFHTVPLVWFVAACTLGGSAAVLLGGETSASGGRGDTAAIRETA